MTVDPDAAEDSPDETSTPSNRAVETTIRRALLQRVANDIAVAQYWHDVDDYEEDDDRWLTEVYPDAYLRCCWQTYPAVGKFGSTIYYHRLCPEGCPHWHHRRELVFAIASP